MTDDPRRAFWAENGYLVVENALDEAEVGELRHAVSELEARAGNLDASTDRFKLQIFDGGGRRIQQAADPHEMGGELMAICRHPAILDTVECLIGGDIQLYYSMLMMKPPLEGAPAPWHQDLAFFPHDRAELLACMVAIDDATPENGCIRVVPGSHKLGLLNHYRAGQFTGEYEGETGSFDADNIAVPVKAGSLILWHCMTVHGSHPNTSPAPRRGLVLQYKNPGASLLAGSFNARREVTSVGMIVRGRDPREELLAAI